MRCKSSPAWIAKKREQEAENAVKRKHILEIMARKRDEALESMTEEELQKLLAETM